MLANQHSEGCLILSRMCALHTQMSLALNFLTVWGKKPLQHSSEIHVSG